MKNGRGKKETSEEREPSVHGSALRHLIGSNTDEAALYCTAVSAALLSICLYNFPAPPRRHPGARL